MKNVSEKNIGGFRGKYIPSKIIFTKLAVKLICHPDLLKMVSIMIILGPDHVQMTKVNCGLKVNCTNIQKYFII